MLSLDIVIPTFNSASTIGQTLESISKQTLLPRDVVLVDDCSTDGTLTEVNKFKSDLNIKIIKFATNSGPWAARNAGVKSSDAEYISFVDSDDVLLDDHIFMHNEVFKQGYDAVATNYFDWIPELNQKRKDPRNFPNVEDKYKLIIKQNFVAGFSSIKREIFENIGGYRPEVTEDWDLWIRFFRGNYAMSKTSSPTYLYRWRAGSISRSLEAHARDLKTLEIARMESDTPKARMSIDFNVISLMIQAYFSRERYLLNDETEIITSFPQYVRWFHGLLKVVDRITPVILKKALLHRFRNIKKARLEKLWIKETNQT